MKRFKNMPPRINKREMAIMRIVFGIAGLIFGALVVHELFKDEFTVGIRDGDGRRGGDLVARIAITDTEGKLLSAFMFLPIAVFFLLFAIQPQLFERHPRVIIGIVGTIFLARVLFEYAFVR